MTPGSPWETTPTAVEQPRLLDYWSLPADGSLGTDRDHEPYDCLVEVERAKKHEHFKIFFDWLIKKYDLDGEYPWGAPEGDPLEDLLSFADWLVESGRGQYETEDGRGDMVGDQDANHRPENPASEGTIPDPNDNEPDHNVNAFPLVEVKLGEIRYSKTWPTDLKEFMEGIPDLHSHSCWVNGGGWIIDFTEPWTLKYEPDRSQFPLSVYTVGDQGDGDTVYDEDEDCISVDSDLGFQPPDNQLGDPDLYPHGSELEPIAPLDDCGEHHDTIPAPLDNMGVWGGPQSDSMTCCDWGNATLHMETTTYTDETWKHMDKDEHDNPRVGDAAHLDPTSDDQVQTDQTWDSSHWNEWGADPSHFDVGDDGGDQTWDNPQWDEWESWDDDASYFDPTTGNDQVHKGDQTWGNPQWDQWESWGDDASYIDPMTGDDQVHKGDQTWGNPHGDQWESWGDDACYFHPTTGDDQVHKGDQTWDNPSWGDDASYFDPTGDDQVHEGDQTWDNPQKESWDSDASHFDPTGDHTWDPEWGVNASQTDMWGNPDPDSACDTWWGWGKYDVDPASWESASAPALQLDTWAGDVGDQVATVMEWDRDQGGDFDQKFWDEGLATSDACDPEITQLVSELEEMFDAPDGDGPLTIYVGILPALLFQPTTHNNEFVRIYVLREYVFLFDGSPRMTTGTKSYLKNVGNWETCFFNDV